MLSFFKKLVAGIESMWKKAPAITVAAASAVNFCVPFIESLDLILTPELAPVLNPILDKIKVGLSALKVTVQEAQAATEKADPSLTANVAAIVASVKSNLGLLESAAEIKNPDLVKKISAVATLVSGELDAISGK